MLDPSERPAGKNGRGRAFPPETHRTLIYARNRKAGLRGKTTEMNEYVKRFDQLTLEELYRILKLRVDVFVVEQYCPYAELDGLDTAALHVWIEEGGEIRAYLRVMDRGAESEHVSIGRVIAAKRGCGLGSRVLQIGIRAAEEIYRADAIYLEAQTYARGLYEKQGFRQISDEFLLDGIPHIKMLREKTHGIAP